MTVKGKKRGRPSGAANQLSAQIIMDMSKSLMREQGKVPSIRKLARCLNVDAMAIYHYFSNKNALLEAITTSLIEEIYLPEEGNFNTRDNWKLELNKLCTSYLSLLSHYPGLLETFLSMSTISPAEVFAARFNIVIEPLHLDVESAKNGLDLLVDYLHGYALALSCNGKDCNSKDSQSTLNMEMLEGPLALYCVALENIMNTNG
ncbi:TetR/AcrR family transcriptional regulator [Shewanella psychropiezotolerans]|uniref:TetR/AcrR family transcriptional regulator n=1 Tax=Shewanella psychropiezotolerans TaxID=2593655 RepID=A0ABX5WY78_9GAMM|nr:MULTISPECIES: TetR/AcrR family transcriptional regulator [Shewanella]MPY26590.1 TetR/AcrR family transcriptional regulator [Shewanella sp. YLB-07]QDO83746.1 TetR/AcrR family transcriptional regulator [Shewanella psychropiezotolerans]